MRSGGNAPQRRANTSQQFRRAERLVDEIVGARIQGPHFVGLRIANGEHNDSHAGTRTDLAAGSQAAHAGHIHVEQDQIGMVIA